MIKKVKNEFIENLAIGIDGTQIPLEYSVESSEQGSISTLVTLDEDGIAKPEFKISARSETTGLYFPIDDTYVHYNKDVEVDEETGEITANEGDQAGTL